MGIEVVSELVNHRHLRALCPVTDIDFRGLLKLDHVEIGDKFGTAREQPLKELVFAGVKRVSDLHLLRHARLEVFAMIQCGIVESVGFLAALPNLKEMEFRDTVVGDGNLIVVTQLPRLTSVEFMPYKKHYQPERLKVERGDRSG